MHLRVKVKLFFVESYKGAEKLRHMGRASFAFAQIHPVLRFS
jgi:hypothetical protein